MLGRIRGKDRIRGIIRDIIKVLLIPDTTKVQIRLLIRHLIRDRLRGDLRGNTINNRVPTNKGSTTKLVHPLNRSHLALPLNPVKLPIKDIINLRNKDILNLAKDTIKVPTNTTVPILLVRLEGCSPLRLEVPLVGNILDRKVQAVNPVNMVTLEVCFPVHSPVSSVGNNTINTTIKDTITHPITKDMRTSNKIQDITILGNREDGILDRRRNSRVNNRVSSRVNNRDSNRDNNRDSKEILRLGIHMVHRVHHPNNMALQIQLAHMASSHIILLLKEIQWIKN